MGGKEGLMDIPTFNIDLSKKCRQCGKNGAGSGKICLKCLNKNIKSGKYNKILKDASMRIKEVRERKEIL